MKKIGLWMAALTAVTVGGVYASFYYSQDVAGINEDKNRSIQITGTANSGSAGTYTIDTTTLIAQIDSAEQYKKDGIILTNIYTGFSEMDNHTALLNITGYITITFDPNENAEQDVQNNGLETVVSFSVNGGVADWSYTYGGETKNVLIWDADSTNDATEKIDTSAFGFTIYPKGTTGDVKCWKWDEEKKKLTYTINAADLFNETSRLINVNPIVLDTIEHHTAYKGALSGKEITVAVSSVGTNPTPDQGTEEQE